MHGVFTDCSHNSDNILKHVRAKVGYPTKCLTVLVGLPHHQENFHRRDYKEHQISTEVL
jgi:hypothetical protein